MKASSKWLYQRISALALIPLSYWFALFMSEKHDFEYMFILSELDKPFIKILMTLFFLFASFHARLGLATIIEDYFKGTTRRIFIRAIDILMAIIILLVLTIWAV